MKSQKLHLWLLVSLTLLLAGCSNSITDAQGRKLPTVGQTARLIEKHGWLATTESSLAELMTPPKINLLAVSPDQAAKLLDAALVENADRLKQEGKVMQVPGSKVRILGYYNGEASNIRPVSPQDQNAMWVKVEVLEGEANGKAGFSTADGVAE